jgi:predicted transcriptional regulator
MPQTALEIAKELTLILVEAGRLSSEDIHDTLRKTHATLLILKAQEETGTISPVPMSETPRARVAWRKSITKVAITCLECGQTFRQLIRRHLMTHGLHGQSYRIKYGIPHTQPLAARETTARRKQIAHERRPWENAPTFRKGLERDGNAPPEPEAQAAREETEEPAAEAPAPAKRARKATPKKTARKKSEG